MILTSTFRAYFWMKFSVKNHTFENCDFGKMSFLPRETYYFTQSAIYCLHMHRSFRVFVTLFLHGFSLIFRLFQHRFRGPFLIVYFKENCFKMASQIYARSTFSAKNVPKGGVPLLTLSTLELLNTLRAYPPTRLHAPP